MAKSHRTALGKSIDMDALRAKNEQVRAVGNMRVNARGDVIDANNRIINDSTKRVNEQYMKTVARPKTIIPDNIAHKPVTQESKTESASLVELTTEEKEMSDEDLDFVRVNTDQKKSKTKSSKKLDQ